MSDAPPSASLRRYLRDAMPAVYLERADDDQPPVVERWLGVFEEQLDPIVTLLDNLHFHLEPATVPDDLSPVLLSWLGLGEEAAALDAAARRRLLTRPADLAAWRGTLRGLRLLVRLAFPGAGIRVDDSAVATQADTPRDHPPAAERVVRVRCTRRMTDAQLRALRRIAEAQLPVGVALELTTVR